MGIDYGFGQRMLFDAQQRFTRSGLKVYLRVRDWLEQEDDGTASDYLEVGVPFSPTGAAAVESGYVDILIDPPPNVVPISMHNIGIMGGQIRFGSKMFWVSHTFVRSQMQALNIQDGDEENVFYDRDGKKAIGIYYDGSLYEIVNPTPHVAGGEIISWKVIGNLVDVRTSQE